MSNKRYEEGFFNEEIKNRYLSPYEGRTRTTYSRVFLRSYTLEDYYKKDLYEFSKPEIEELLKSFRPEKVSSGKQIGYIISNYITWAINEGYRSNNINPLSNVSAEWYGQFVDKTKKTIFSKTEIDDMIAHCVNAQDSAIIKLLFEGVMGEGYDELLNLKSDDIDIQNNTLRLRSNIRERYLTVSEECMVLISKALNAKDYIKKNGEGSENLKAREAKLVENNHVIRLAMLRTNHQGKTDHHVVLRRLKTISNVLQLPYLKAINIRNSGMLYMAKNLLERDGELEKLQYNEISERYGVSRIMNNGYEEYNVYQYRREFLNLQTINQIYDENESNGNDLTSGRA